MEVKGLSYNVRADVDVIMEGTRRVHDNVDLLAKHGVCPSFQYLDTRTDFSSHILKQQSMNYNVRYPVAS